MKKVRVAQCWDDGVFTDIRLIEILKKYNAKATFNLCPGLIPEQTKESHWITPEKDNILFMRSYFAGKIGKDRLMEVYKDFDVACHCNRHENALKTDSAVFLESALEGRRFLEEFFQKECPGFVWPFGTYTEETVQLLHKAGFAYGRTTENTDDVLSFENPLKMANSSHFMNEQFWVRYNRAKETSGVFYFWGHSYEITDFQKYWEHLEFIIKTISEDPEAEWVNVVDLVK